MRAGTDLKQVARETTGRVQVGTDQIAAGHRVAGAGAARGLRDAGAKRRSRQSSGSLSHARGIDAEAVACAALERDGWTVLGRRLRTPLGEVDTVAERDGLLAIIEVKARPTLSEAAWALTGRQQRRLLGAGEALLAEHPDWGRQGVRFDVLLVDQTAAVRRVADAFRLG